MKRFAPGLALLLAGAAVFALSASPIWRFLRNAGAGMYQRPLVGSGSGRGPRPEARGPTRVVLLDGLSYADASRLRSLQALCSANLDLTVDVGFPTKSLPSQYVLFTGLTSQQAGISFDNDPIPTPPHAIPAQVPGSIAVVENTRGIAGSFGFTTLLPDASADVVDHAHDPRASLAWHEHGFADAAVAAVSSSAPLAFIHVVSIDDNAHAFGRRAPEYDRALAYADGVLARVIAALPPDASLLVLADHGHVMDGGHGDAEHDTRLVRACIEPHAPARGSAHEIDLSRWIADHTGASLAPDARGRPIDVAIANPDPDATIPTVGLASWIAAVIALLAIAIAALRLGAPVWAFAAPLAALALAWLIPGMPTLSRHPRLELRWIATAPPVFAIAFALRGKPARTVALACAAPPFALAIACAILCGVPAALFGGPPARMPWWTGELLFWLPQLAGALCAAGLAIVVRLPDSRQSLVEK